MKKQVFEKHGLIFSCATAKVGETVEIIYTGLLKNSGATEVNVHIGYNELWDDAETINMQLKDDAFVASFKLAQAGILNCAFVDSIGNWDNNSGTNYSLPVAKTARKTTAAKKTTTSKAAASKTTAAKKTTTAKAAATKTTAAKKTTTSKAAPKKTAAAKKTTRTKKTTTAKSAE